MTDPARLDPTRTDAAHTRRLRRPGSAASAILRPMFIDVVERDHSETDAAHRRRQMIVAVTLVLGATLLGLSLSVRAGDPLFYYLTFALAAVWAAGAFLLAFFSCGCLSALAVAIRYLVGP